ncbi:MAG: hypothetical protein E4H27_00485 [Anaerolineales bacterium]|nr:MAG: hypothetical protein E4H27_00485 [Anaerolineales bacterium]
MKNSIRESISPWIMVVLRTVLFGVFQAAIAGILLLQGGVAPWNASAGWWPIGVVLTNLVCLILLIRLYQQEGKRFWDVFRIERQFVRRDLVFMLGFLVIAGLLGYLPNILSAQLLFGDPQVALDLLVRPLPVRAAIFSFVFFPVLQGLVEIPTYMLYALPRLEARGLRPWLAVSVVSFFLSAQHIFAPFIPDVRFVLYRLVMFMPFAFLLALVMRRRPRLMPYMVVVHVLMDMSIGVMFLLVMV